MSHRKQQQFDVVSAAEYRSALHRISAEEQVVCETMEVGLNIEQRTPSPIESTISIETTVKAAENDEVTLVRDVANFRDWVPPVPWNPIDTLRFHRRSPVSTVVEKLLKEEQPAQQKRFNVKTCASKHDTGHMLYETRRSQERDVSYRTPTKELRYALSDGKQDSKQGEQEITPSRVKAGVRRYYLLNHTQVSPDHLLIIQMGGTKGEGDVGCKHDSKQAPRQEHLPYK